MADSSYLTKIVEPFVVDWVSRRIGTTLTPVGKHRTKKDTVNEALKEYVMRRKRKDVSSLFGKVEMVSSYDYRKDRNAR
jgi:hypothetical protein